MHPDCGFLGLKHVRALQAADAKKMFPDLLVQRQKEMSDLHGRECSTFRFEALGQMLTFTSDPENIKGT